MTLFEAEEALQGSGLSNLRRLANPGLNLVAERTVLPAQPESARSDTEVATRRDA
jgi:hypothetical protein